VSRLSAFLQEKFESEVAAIQLNLFLLMLCIVLIQHVTSCIWLGMGTMSTDEATWLSNSAVSNQPLMTRYWACMRWSLAQLGFGATHIEAVTELE
ncbi:Kcnh7, partial [Symbiodinium sp. KB8]